MSDSETKQLHIFMRKGLKGTYIDKSEKISQIFRKISQSPK